MPAERREPHPRRYGLRDALAAFGGGLPQAGVWVARTSERHPGVGQVRDVLAGPDRRAWLLRCPSVVVQWRENRPGAKGWTRVLLSTLRPATEEEIRTAIATATSTKESP